MKHISLLTAFLSLSLLCVQANPVRDGGFELPKGASGISRAWKYKEFHGAEAVMRLEERKTNPGAGKKSALIRRLSSGSLGGIHQEKIPAKENTAYILSARAQTGKNTAVFLRVEFINDAGVLLGELQSGDRSFAKWGTHSFAFQTPAGTHTLNIILAMRGTSWAAFDQVQLKVNKKSQAVDWAGFAARCLPVETVRAWSGKPVFSTFADSPASLTFQFKGKYATLVKPAFVLDLPAELVMAEAFQQHPSWGTALKPEITSLKIKGKNYKRYRFVNPPFFKTLMNSWGWRRMMSVAVMPSSASQTGKSFTAYWHLENKNSKSKVSAFTIRILPPLPEKKMPKNFYIGFWTGYENDHPSKEVFFKVLRKWEKSNFIGTTRLSVLKKNDEIMRKRNWKIASGSFQGDQSYQFKSLPSHLKKKLAPRFYSTSFDGKPYKQRMCPTFFLTDPDYSRHTSRSMKKALARTLPGEMVFLDTEPWRPHNWCYCKACIGEFKKFAKTPHTPSVKELRSKYYAKWRAFRVEQSRQVVAKLAKEVRKVRPDAKIYDYDYPINYDSQKAIDTFLSRCSKDPRGNEAVIDGHLSSYYHTLDKNMFTMTEINLRHLKKDYFLILAIDPPGYLAKASVLSPARFRIMLEGAAALGAKGIWIYSMSVVDGTMALAAHQAMVKIARFEEFYKGKNLAKTLKVASNSKETAHTLHKHNGKTLVTLFNFDAAKSVRVTLPLPAGAKDGLTGKAVKRKGGKATLTLPPSGSSYIVY